MSQANEERGQIDIELEGVSYVLQPSFEAQVAIERQTGKSIEQLAHSAGAGAMGYEDAAIVVAECVKARGRAINDDTLAGFNARRVGECIAEAPGGKLAVTKRLELLLYLAATGGYTAKGEARALPTVSATPAEQPASGD